MKLMKQQSDCGSIEGIPIESLVYSSRIRLARNLRGIPFPGWAGPQERSAVWGRVIQTLRESRCMKAPRIRSMGELEPLERTLLQERRLISFELAAGDATSGVMYESSGRLSVMVNEEDHVRLQSVSPGFALTEAWNAIRELHTELEAALPFAFSSKYGYLTACPSNVGTGIRASVMVHLAALRLTGELDAVVRGLERTGFAVRGASGEGSSAHGGFYQISNQKTLGLDEQQTLFDVQRMVTVVLQAEYRARERLEYVRPLALEDTVSRAYALLRHVRLLTAGESLDLLSAILLGLDQGLIKGVAWSMVRDLLQEVQPGHLQIRYGRTLASWDRDRYRATLVRQALAAMELI